MKYLPSHTSRFPSEEVTFWNRERSTDVRLDRAQVVLHARFNYRVEVIEIRKWRVRKGED